MLKQAVDKQTCLLAADDVLSVFEEDFPSADCCSPAIQRVLLSLMCMSTCVAGVRRFATFVLPIRAFFRRLFVFLFLLLLRPFVGAGRRWRILRHFILHNNTSA